MTSILAPRRFFGYSLALLCLFSVALVAQSGPADRAIDAATRSAVIDAAVARLHEFYVFPDTAKRMEEAVRARLKAGEYNSVTSGLKFAELLTEHFQAVSRDKHLRVNYSAMPFPELPQGEPSAEVRQRQLEVARATATFRNCGFQKVERLVGNIGYLKFDGFDPPELCGETVAAAMTFVSGTNALIIDMRDNGGGAPAMVALICSYLFDRPVHLNDVWTRRTDETIQWWTQAYVPGRRLPMSVPVYVLTSNRTFSGGEEFTNNLKVLKRATIVGEVTGGGAHPVAGHRIHPNFMIGVPFARAINAVTKTNWEGTGVEPDVEVKREIAFETAYKAILENRLPTAPSPAAKTVMEQEIARLAKEIEAKR